MKKLFSKISDYFSDDLNRIKFVSLIIFIVIIMLLAWQSDDAYHAYAMAKNLVDGHGFVYNVGERATASSCPLFTLVVAFGYLLFRNMFLVSIIICVIFSASAYGILIHGFCNNKWQVVTVFTILVSSISFVSYTTAGLENCMLFFLAALFLKAYFKEERDTFDAKTLLYLAVLISLIAMTRMDAVLMFVPAVVYVFLAKRQRQVSFFKAVGIGFAGLSPFIVWELFSLIYYGFFVPNTAFVKLGTDIPRHEYIVRGVLYIINAVICDPIVIFVPFGMIVTALVLRKAKYIYVSLGVLLYGAYILYIGGDFMMGRHFTVMFFMSVIAYLEMHNYEMPEGSNIFRNRRLDNFMRTLVIVCLIYSVTSGVISNQFKFGATFSSPISDERATYFQWTSLFNNAVSYFTTGDMCIQNAWNDQGVRDLREGGLDAGIITMVPGVTKYYNSDMYLNDLYALGDPYLSKLPAVRVEGWRIGHMYREAPRGYNETIMYNEGNRIENEAAAKYYEVIKLITRGKIFDSNRLKAVIDINLGKYDYLIEQYKSSLDENYRQK